jgi:hypothetical protein
MRIDNEVAKGYMTRYRYVMTVKDHFTRYTWLRLIPDKQCSTVASNVKHMIECCDVFA